MEGIERREGDGVGTTWSVRWFGEEVTRSPRWVGREEGGEGGGA